MPLMILSFDAVSNEDIDFLLKQKHFGVFAQKGTLVRETESVFISNTYPAHTSVITGMRPNKHGIIENLYTQPERDNWEWRWYRKAIQTTTLYDEAAKQHLKTCSILWPVTAGAKIKYNMPEIFPTRGENQLMLSLKTGSKLFQLQCFLRYASLMDGFKQPALDNFSFASALFALKHYRFDLLLLHLTDVDTHKHYTGVGSSDTHAALKRLDDKLGILMAQYPKWDILIFGDHSSLPVQNPVNLNALWNIPQTYWHHAGGCAFLKILQGSPPSDLEPLITSLWHNPDSHIRRILPPSEMAESGLDREFAVGVEANPGYHFGGTALKGQHGYTLHNDPYKTFYAVAGQGIPAGVSLRGGSICDVAPLAARLLKVPLWEMDGQARI